MSPDEPCMDSFQKRQRERGKIEKRQEKEARKKERAESIHLQPADSDNASAAPGGDESPAGDAPATGRNSQELLP